MTGGKLLASYIFGSVGRGQSDGYSDLDILAVVKNGSGKVDEATVTDELPAELAGLKPSISWYGSERLKQMFANGELFAWHLYRETIPLIDPQRLLESFGPPTAYLDCEKDVASFIKVLDGIPEQIQRHRGNAIYEAGLVYVCLRNIAMAASWQLCPEPDFSRYSIFKLEGFSEFPLSQSEFETAMFCRMSGQRGSPPPDGVHAEYVMDIYNRVSPWLRRLQRTLSKGSTVG
ncbi:hypothetical protein GOZ83_28195 [Agrobacterium vitis]|uniref:nucleotidyltransferase domain-containing protein n=1 Tax=Rhizobium/Agrobacterium group TaxID=227290 RepID=UPI0012E91BA4|nr:MULTISPECIES: nucleotidyltransferase domain-containing protein [Rhizobium/Agrobacterium group]MCF1450566.1 nucleotidyltransferase domain-containing protein [Allorhizobium ampelinum]MCF1496187.1 nucleotidyltransferase domain-containing protein [Allorhizobium ampelinum]MVA48895.1 hypothetical protein [Agrobacterium vitis]